MLNGKWLCRLGGLVCALLLSLCFISAPAIFLASFGFAIVPGFADGTGDAVETPPVLDLKSLAPVLASPSDLYVPVRATAAHQPSAEPPSVAILPTLSRSPPLL